MSTQITQATRRIVAARSGGVCELRVACEGDRATELHHRRPRGMGGTSRTDIHGPAWLIHACHACHQGRRGVESHRELAFDLGWLLRDGEQGDLVPARIWTQYGRGDYLLDDDGMVMWT